MTRAVCHGAQGEGNRSPNAPRLTHLAPVYIVAQLQKFKQGTRGGSDAVKVPGKWPELPQPWRMTRPCMTPRPI